MIHLIHCYHYYGYINTTILYKIVKLVFSVCNKIFFCDLFKCFTGCHLSVKCKAWRHRSRRTNIGTHGIIIYYISVITFWGVPSQTRYVCVYYLETFYSVFHVQILYCNYWYLALKKKKKSILQLLEVGIPNMKGDVITYHEHILKV